MSHSEPDRYPARPLLFVALMALGVAYLVAFVWLRLHSRDFVAADLDARAHAAASQLAPAAALSFASDGNAIALLGEGWQLPAADGSWSRPEGGVLYLPASAAGKTLHLEFAAHFYGGEEPLWVRLDIDGQPLGEWNPTPWSHQVAADLRLPLSTDAVEPLRLQFRIERHAALLWHGVDSGARAYGIRLSAMQLGDANSLE